MIFVTIADSAYFSPSLFSHRPCLITFHTTSGCGGWSRPSCGVCTMNNFCFNHCSFQLASLLYQTSRDLWTDRHPPSSLSVRGRIFIRRLILQRALNVRCEKTEHWRSMLIYIICQYVNLPRLPSDKMSMGVQAEYESSAVSHHKHYTSNI